MDDISSLIKEAKPLYLARKKRNARIKSGLATLLCFAFIGGFYSGSTAEKGYLFQLDNEIYLTENGSVIEDMGLPTDEYGMLMVG